MAERTRHSNFKKYVEFIATHPNYKWLFFERKKDWSIKWVVTWKSDNWQKRREWWDQQCIKHGIKIEPWCYAKIAVKIHPTKKHTCQICGKELFIEYVYPNNRLLEKINSAFNVNFIAYTYTVFDIIDSIRKGWNEKKVFALFKLDYNGDNKDSLKEYIYNNYTLNSDKTFLSPGVMSNSPDRVDWFHSDWNCCRSESDKWRHKDNLSRYSNDRRAFENWSDGNRKMADRLMSKFSDYWLSADHIWPISLGFCHRPKFQPLTKEKNSSKNNRMSYNDVKSLLVDEKKWEQVISWHSKYIWDLLKDKVNSDKDAIKLSNLMRMNLHYVLTLFSMISEWWYNEFLKQFLHPKYSFFDYEFEWFNPKDWTYKKVVSIKRTGKNQQNAATRYIRVSFESLEEYKSKDNRKNKIWKDKDIDKKVNYLLIELKQNHQDEALKTLHNILNCLSIKLASLRNAS